MTTKTLLLAPASALVLAAVASAQVEVFTGPNPSPNGSTVVDFDAPLATLGPIASNDAFFTSAGISSVNVVGTWTAAADTLNAGGINVIGQSLAVQNGALTVVQAGDAIDQPDADAGFEITLAAPVNEIGWLFTDQNGMDFNVELFDGATSLGVFLRDHPGNAAPVIARASSASFDRVLITFPGTGGLGLDQISFGTGPGGPDPVPDDCLQTFFVGGNGGNQNNAVFFDLTTTESITFDSLRCYYNAPAGASVGIQVYTTPDTRTAKETDASQWTLVAQDNGLAVAQWDLTEINLDTPFTLPAGTVGMALVAVNAAHRYTTGDGTNETAMSADGKISFGNPAAMNNPFTVSTVFQPRVANIRLCPGSGGAPIGTAFCAANPNSTGMPGLCTATGSTAVADNNVILRVSQVPAGEFGIFVVALAAGGTTTVNDGLLCLTGPTGRYDQAGFIWQASPAGSASRAIDLTMVPTPNAFVNTNPGDTWFFQAWHRDVPSGNSNFTTGVEINFN